jgi:hypothetical protein
MSRHSSHETEVRRHERVDALLPWYLNQTLADGERREVDEHLEACATCRRTLEVERNVAEALRAGAEPAPAPHPQQLARLLERVDQAEAAPQAARAEAAPVPSRLQPTWRGALAGLRRAAGGGSAWKSLAALQAAAMVALLGVLLARLDGVAPTAGAPTAGAPAAGTPAAAYRTLSDAPPAAPEAAPLRLRVIFSPATPEDEMRALLAQVGAQIVAGPSPLGAYTLELRPSPDSESPQLVLAVLRASPAVRFAEPIVAGAARRPR